MSRLHNALCKLPTAIASRPRRRRTHLILSLSQFKICMKVSILYLFPFRLQLYKLTADPSGEWMQHPNAWGVYDGLVVAASEVAPRSKFPPAVQQSSVRLQYCVDTRLDSILQLSIAQVIGSVPLPDDPYRVVSKFLSKSETHNGTLNHRMTSLSL